MMAQLSTTRASDKLERPSLIDVLESRLRTDILDGVYPTGTLLPPERELAARYHVTRASIKNTLVRLEQLGLVSTRHGVGSRVEDFRSYAGIEIVPWLIGQEGIGLVSDIFEARRDFGALVAGHAARRITEPEAAELSGLVDSLLLARSPAATHDIENEIHRTIARISGNKVYLHILNSVLKSYEPVRCQLDVTFADAPGVAEAIRPLVDAIENRDVDGARRAADVYMSATERPMLDVIAGLALGDNP